MHEEAAETQAISAFVHDLVISWHNKSTQECASGMMQLMPCSCMQLLLGSSKAAAARRTA